MRWAVLIPVQTYLIIMHKFQVLTNGNVYRLGRNKIYLFVQFKTQTYFFQFILEQEVRGGGVII